MSKIKKDAICGILDQGLISISNLGIGLFLINFTSKTNYGLYGIGFASILLAIGVANALITTQMLVISHEKEAHDQERYCCSMLFAQYLIFIPAWILFEIAITLFYFYSLMEKGLFIYLTVIATTILAALFHEFMRRYYYQTLNPYRVLQIDIFNVIFIFSSLILAALYKLDMLHIWAIGIYGASAFMAAALGLAFSKLLQKVHLLYIKEAIIESWLNGRWALGGVIVTWLQSQGYAVLLSILATPAGIAEANAARLFLAPVGIISTSLSQVFMPRLALLKCDNKHKEVRILAKKILFLVNLTICLIVFGVYLTKDLLIKLFFSKDYANIEHLVFLWCIVFLFQTFRTNTSMLLQIYKKFRIITLSNTGTAILTLLLGVVLIKHSGVLGSILAIAIGEFFLALLLWRAFNAYTYNNP